MNGTHTRAHTKSTHMLNSVRTRHIHTHNHYDKGFSIAGKWKTIGRLNFHPVGVLEKMAPVEHKVVPIRFTSASIY